MDHPMTPLGVAAATPTSPPCGSDRGDAERARRAPRVGRFGARSDVTLIPAPVAFEQAACRERPDLGAAWDMVETTPRSRDYVPPALVSEAVAVCGGCPHLIQCGEHALRVGEPVGVWGGLKPSQRAELRRLAGRA